MAIEKSKGTTPTEELLSELCERSFLKLWSYPNPQKEDGKELCDLLVVFDDNILIFFDRESKRLKSGGGNIGVDWSRWKKEVIDKQITTAKGAARYIASKRQIFLSRSGETEFPIPIPDGAKIFKLIVAHGAMEACRAQSEQNVSGSLAILYTDLKINDIDEPFFITLPRDDIVHVLDSENLAIVLSELDTIFDFSQYLIEKESAIARFMSLTYCGEEDLLAHYLINMATGEKRHQIGVNGDYDLLGIGEGEWSGFVESAPYKARKAANEGSYLWDRLIQITAENALKGTGLGNSNPFVGRSAINYMAREPRFVRRALSDRIRKAIEDFPQSDAPIVRYVSLLPSFFERQAYVFLQLKVMDKGDYATEYRPKRTALLEIACAAAKLKWPNLERVIGIAIDAPKYAGRINSEDLALMEFDNWTEEVRSNYEEINRELKFFANPTETRQTVYEFPVTSGNSKRRRRKKVGANERCPCGSGKKYKKCCRLTKG